MKESSLNQFNEQFKTIPESHSSYQGFILELGFVMILLGLVGIFWPTFLGLHLSIMHSLVLSTTGLLAVWSGLSIHLKSTFRISLGLGTFYLLHSLIGYLAGDPGTPHFGFFSERNFTQTAPGFLELSVYDHLMHGILSLAFFREAFITRTYKKVHPKIYSKYLARVAILLFTVVMILLIIFQITRGIKLFS